ncbi:hypothetical protein Nepgr_029772 [Nepenthes gracilis]|uniref:Uncharacterized protein n=1 Tax=Nepenthes gracilis TaxID=150966 RepID=A0AAD3Y5E8_NEPGR|nr:hypothetical protein Nepgr_029772 [Nepenthes gracilis]
MEFHDEDLHVKMEDRLEELMGLGRGENLNGLEAEEVMSAGGRSDGGGGVDRESGRHIWLGRVAEEHTDLLGASDPSHFFTDFPPLPHFPCVSSSSSSSSTPVLAKPFAGSSSACSFASFAPPWAVLRSDAELDHDFDRKNHHQQHYR